MSPPTVSVAMSVHNGQAYLREAVDSILGQTFADFDFIIVDDGSMDETADILRAYAAADSRIKLIVNAQNIGLTRSLNKAIRRAEGQYIARMDADDIALPLRFERQMQYLKDAPEVGLLGTAYYEVNQRGRIIGERVFPATNGELQKILIKYNPFFHSSVMIRRRVLDEVGLYDENIPMAQDYDLWFRIAGATEIGNLSELLMKRRYAKENISISKGDEQIFWAQQARRKAIERGQYSAWCRFYLFRPFLVSKTPAFLKYMVRKYLLGRRVYD